MKDKKTEQMPFISIENMKKYYPVKGGIISHVTDHIKAVDGVGFTIQEGETLGLVGESGCGKSTIANLLVGLEKPDEGTFWYDGQNVTDMSENEQQKLRTQIQMVFQDSYSSLNPRKHIYEILAQPMLHHQLATRKTMRKELENLLNMVGLPRSALRRYPHEFSGGQRQRICIAKALSLKPRFLVCDEAVSALDVSIQAQILNLLKQLQQELQLTCMFIGHGLGAVNYVSDRIAVMYLGKIVEIAPAKQLFQSPAHPYTKALCNAVPVPELGHANSEILLQGEISSALNLPQGCRFHPRCPYATKRCMAEEPQLLPIDEKSQHVVACYHMQHKQGGGIML